MKPNHNRMTGSKKTRGYDGRKSLAPARVVVTRRFPRREFPRAVGGANVGFFCKRSQGGGPQAALFSSYRIAKLVIESMRNILSYAAMAAMIALTWSAGGTAAVQQTTPARKTVAKKTVVVLSIGSALVLPWADKVDAIMENWYGGQQVGSGNIRDVDKIHRLGAVAKDQRAFAGRDALHPADQDLGIGAKNIHARPVDIEVSQGDVIQPGHIVKTAQQTFVEDFGGAVQGAVAVGVMVFGGGEFAGQAVYGCAGCGNDTANSCLQGGLEHVIRAVHQDLQRQARFFGALGDTDGSLVKQ